MKSTAQPARSRCASETCTPTARVNLEQYQQAIVDRADRDLADLYSADGIHEISVLLPGMPARYIGPDQIRTAYGRA